MEIWKRQKAPQITERLSVPYVLLFSFFSLTIFPFLFFVKTFFFCSYPFDIFSQQGAHKNKPQKIELNWIKDVAYRKSGLCSQKHTKTCGPGNSIFLIEFHKSNFCEPRLAGMKQI